ncbi:MAG: IS110 family transposase [Anaerolineae bacterium]
MRFYEHHHLHYCGIDLHASWMYLCIQDDRGTILLHRNLPTCSEAFQAAVQPYRQDLAVAVECMFSWYWIADLCAQMNITFVLGHALYMKAIHGGKTKNDKIDSKKIASLLRAKMLPVAYPYPQATRSTRDLLRRRMYFMHHQSELLTHIQNTNTQYNLPGFSKRIDRHSNRVGLPELFPDPMVRKSIEADVVLLDVYHAILLKLERQVLQQARHHDPVVLGLLRTVPGIGKILALVMIYEIHDIRRFPTVGDFISYCRLVKPARESAGKKQGSKNAKIGNVHLKWAFSEAACLFLRANSPAKELHQRLVSKYGKSKALSIIAQKLGRTVYSILKHRQPFDPEKFFHS